MRNFADVSLIKNTKKRMEFNDELYNNLLLMLAHTQLQLEVMDNVKDTAAYKYTLKQNINRLEKSLENLLSGPFEEVYVNDEKSFKALTGYISDITKWIASSSFDDIAELGNAIKKGELKFIDEEVSE